VIDIYLSPPHLSHVERAMLVEAFDSNWVTSAGPHLGQFEQEAAGLIGAPAAVALASGTAALHLGLLALGVGPGDRVIVPSFTFAATANAVVYTGATPVFVDVSPDTWTLDPDLLADELRRRYARGEAVKAVIPVDLYGQCCDYDPILASCRTYGVQVVEDAAEALGSTYRGRAAGTFGDVGIVSFNGNKILTTGSGGMLFARPELAEQVRYLSSQARDPVPHYEHRAVGFNYRMNNLLAAVGRAQLTQLADRVAARRRIYARYQQLLAGTAGLMMMPLADYGRSNCWLSCLLIDEDVFGARSEQVRGHLAAHGIEARPTWKPMHLQPVYAGCDMVGGAVCEDLFRRGLCLPSGSALSPGDQDRVVEQVLAAANGKLARRDSGARTA
jgi:dTDP-4-amino-4,6-dideoxygalactose transaminase